MSDTASDGPALQFLARQGWHLRDTYTMLLPITPINFLTGQVGVDRATAQFKLWRIKETTQADEAAPNGFSFSTSGERLPLAATLGGFPEIVEGSEQILNVTTNVGGTRLYLLMAAIQKRGQQQHTLYILRYHFNPQESCMGTACGELIPPTPLNTYTPDFTCAESVAAWQETLAAIQGHPQLLAFIQNNTTYGGFRGKLLLDNPSFAQYHFLFTQREHLYLVYPLYNPEVTLWNTLPIYQIMCVFCERTGAFTGAYLLTTPQGMSDHSADVSPGLFLRTNAFCLDQHVFFTQKQISLDRLLTLVPGAKIKGWSPAALCTKAFSPLGQQPFSNPNSLLFTTLPVDSLPTGWGWQPPITFQPLTDNMVEPSTALSPLCEMDYSYVSVDGDQRYLYGLAENRVQQHYIEYAAIEVKHPHTGAWLPGFDFTLDFWEFRSCREFRVRNLARRSILRNVQLRSLDSQVLFSSSLTGAKGLTAAPSPTQLAPQAVTESIWLHDMRTMPAAQHLKTHFDLSYQVVIP